MNTSPKHVLKYCMRCGSNAVNYEANNSLVCKDCGFKFFVNEVAAVAAVIVNEKGKVLFSQRAFNPAKGKFDLPGGFVDLGESAEQAVVRELKEELNIEVDSLAYMGSYPNEYLYDGLTVYTLDMAFICKVSNFDTIEARDDVADFKFYDISEVNDADIAFKSVKNIIKDFKAKKQK